MCVFGSVYCVYVYYGGVGLCAGITFVECFLCSPKSVTDLKIWVI